MISLFQRLLRRVRFRPAGQHVGDRLPAGLRLYAIGDVHGRLDLLEGVFERIDADVRSRPCERNLTILLGDMVDRGPDSYGVIERVIERRASHWLLPMRGNHEQCLLDFLEDPETLLDWSEFGAFSTLLSYGVTPRRGATAYERGEIRDEFLSAVPGEHLDFYRNLTISFSCHGYFFAHAGVRPYVALREQAPKDLLWIRKEFLAHRGAFERVVVHGHTPVREPEILPNRINIDTGAYATGRLTCLVLEDNAVSLL